MDFTQMLADLTAERDRIDRAISALQTIDDGSGAPQKRGPGRPAGSTNGRKKRHMSASARKRISEAMTARWKNKKK